VNELEIIGAPQSTFVRTVRIACEEKQVPYRLTPAVPHSPEVNAIHPLGTIPVMRHGDFRLFESKAIVTYHLHRPRISRTHAASGRRNGLRTD